MKIEDLTLKEIKQMCEKSCGKCPLRREWEGRTYRGRSCLINHNYLPYKWTDDDMGREVEAK